MNNECFFCDESLTEEEMEAPYKTGDNLVCDECYHDNFCFVCPICEEYSDDEETHFVLTEKDNTVPVGYYEILKHPFYISHMLGTDEIWPHCVKKVADLRGNEDRTGYICPNCMKKAVRMNFIKKLYEITFILHKKMK